MSASASSRVAIVVATRNRAATLAATLPRLAEQAGAARVVVVDDASDDDTAAVAAAAGEPVTAIRLDESRGAAARNAGVAAVDQPYVAFADDDSWWAPGALERAARLLDAHPRLALVAARVVVEPAGRDDPTSVAMARSPLPRAPGLPGPAVLGFVACGAVVRRSAFERVGGFASGFGVGGEEELLALDLAAAGWRLAYVPGVVAHHAPAAAGCERPERRATLVRNALWVAWMRRPPGAALGATAAALRGALRDADARRGVAQALRGAPARLAERRTVPAPVERSLRLLGA